MKFFIAAFIPLLFLSTCGPVIPQRTTSQLKIVRVISHTEAEVIVQGSIQLISLAGVYSITEHEYSEKFIKTHKIDSKYNDEILSRIKSASDYFSSLVSPGDVLYAIDVTKEPDSVKTKEFVVYTPDLVSINEKLVSNGHGFPGSETVSHDFNLKIKNAFVTQLLYQRGLWRIGKVIRDDSEMTHTEKKTENLKPEKDLTGIDTRENIKHGAEKPGDSKILETKQNGTRADKK